MQIQPGRVTVQEGVVYGTGGDRELRCDVYTPPEPATAAPAVLLVHGGAWIGGDRSQLRGYGIQFARRGFVCVACDYRLAPDDRWPAQLHDVKAALRWMHATSTDLGIDPERICVSGNSAGAHLALMLAGTTDKPEFDGDGGHVGASTRLAAVVGFYAPTSLGGEKRLTDAVQALMGPAADDAVIKSASPITHVHADFPPTLLITGNRDEVVPHQGSFNMYSALEDAGADVELHVYNGAPHAFDTIPEFGRECVTLVMHFLDRHVVAPRPAAIPVPAA